MAFSFSHLSLEAQGDVFRFLRREVCEQVLNASLDEGFNILQEQGRVPGSPEYRWFTDQGQRQKPFEIKLPLTSAELGFLAQDNPRLKPSELRLTATIADFKPHDSKNRPYFPGEGVGTMALSAKCRIHGETMVRSRTHDVKIVSLLSPGNRESQTQCAQNAILDYTLFVRNGSSEFSNSGSGGSNSQLKVRYDAGAPPDRSGGIFLGMGQPYSGKALSGTPGQEFSISPGRPPALTGGNFFQPRFRNLSGGLIQNPAQIGEQGIQPFRHINLASRRIAVSSADPEAAGETISGNLQECGVLDEERTSLQLHGITIVQGGAVDLNASTPDLLIRGRGVLIADEVSISCGLKVDESVPGGSMLIICSRKGPISIRTGNRIEAALIAMSWEPGTTGRLAISPGAKLDLKGLIAVDELGLGTWPANTVHTLTDDPRFHLGAGEAPLFAISLARSVTWQQTMRESD